MKYLVIILFSFLLNPIFADPISLKNDWFAKDGADLSEFKSEEWQEFKNLPLGFGQIKSTQNNLQIRSVTLYKEFELNKEFLNQPHEDLSILIPYASNVWKIYFNKEEIGGRGKIENDKVVLNGIRRGEVILIPRNLLREKNEIRIILSSDPRDYAAIHSEEGANYFVIDTVKENIHRASERTTLMLIFMYLFVGLYHLLLFIKRPKEKYNFYFGAYSFLIGIYAFTRSNTIFDWNLEPFKILIRTEFIVVFLLFPIIIFFLDSFFFPEKKFPLITKIYFYFVLFLCALILFVPVWISYKVLLIWQLTALFVFIYVVYTMIKAMRTGNKDARRLFIGFVFLFIATVWDLIGSMQITSIKNLGLAKYAFFIFVIGIAVVLANKFLRVHNQVEELNADLELKVEERTRELQKTLSEVKELKVQQDGDYFLISLLIKPLGVNDSKSKIMNIDFFVRQKKKFEFKKWYTEIGGDLCISQTIRLKDKDYTVFLNGDAMGKSIQGAGGALVLGVVFKSILTRTQNNPITQNRYPEQWLKMAFLELQDIFVSFDGSMLVSMVLGMVDDLTGFIYYINAEHPWSVLYRDSKASFMDTNRTLYKIGVTGIQGELSIKTFQLEPRDVIIIGSDGRDDLIIGTDELGNRIINEDENQFLKRVEEGNGNLEQIALAVEKAGEITDDFTMVRIGYQENSELIENENLQIEEKMKSIQLDLVDSKIEVAEIKLLELYELNPNHKELLKELVKLFLKKKDFKQAAFFSEKVLYYFPTESEYIYFSSYCFKMIKEFNKAIDLGERLKLREPYNVKNLLNLIDSYRLVGNFERAKKLLLKSKEIESENPNIKKLDLALNQTILQPQVIE
jgi:hypothetical protein